MLQVGIHDWNNDVLLPDFATTCALPAMHD
jgi:hypothetical protein